MKHTIIAATLAAALLVAAAALTGAGPAPTSTSADGSRAYLHSYNLPSTGLALEGYCPVAYFAANRPIKGKARHNSTHNNVTYYFVSKDAKKAFDTNPEKYLPAYGGWCAFGMSIEDKFPVDPTNFKIVDGQLMVFLRNTTIDARALWNKGDESQLRSKAEAHWRTVSR